MLVAIFLFTRSFGARSFPTLLAPTMPNGRRNAFFGTLTMPTFSACCIVLTAVMNKGWWHSQPRLKCYIDLLSVFCETSNLQGMPVMDNYHRQGRYSARGSIACSREIFGRHRAHHRLQQVNIHSNGGFLKQGVPLIIQY